jgi:single-strand DNA-binding protein
MASVNRVILVGNLGADPELRHTNNKTAVASLNLATKEFRTERDGNRQEYTEWHRIVVWGRQAENCAKYLSKGRPVFIEGRLQTRSWEDKTGVKRFTTEIVANNVQFLGGGASANRESTSNDTSNNYGDANSNRSNDGAQTPTSNTDGMSFGGSSDTSALDDIPF